MNATTRIADLRRIADLEQNLAATIADGGDPTAIFDELDTLNLWPADRNGAVRSHLAHGVSQAVNDSEYHAQARGYRLHSRAWPDLDADDPWTVRITAHGRHYAVTLPVDATRWCVFRGNHATGRMLGGLSGRRSIADVAQWAVNLIVADIAA